MDFGISLEASSVIQRHSLEDSDEEEEESGIDTPQTEYFISPDKTCTLGLHGGNLILALGHAASIFVKSFLTLEAIPSCTIKTNSPTVFKDKYFSTSPKTEVVSEGFVVKGKTPESENFLVCTHEQPLTSLHCNSWCARVSMHGVSLWCFNHA